MLNVSSHHDFRSVLNDLHSKNPAVEEKAREIVSSMCPSELLILLRMELQRSRSARHRDISFAVLAQLGIVAGIIGIFLVIGLATQGGAAFDGCSGGWPGVDLPAGDVTSSELRYLANTLTRSQDPTAVGTILEAATLSPFLSRSLSSTLFDRLRKTSPEEARYWSPVWQRLLLRQLKTIKGDKRATLAILHALGCVGTSEAIVPVYRMIRDEDSDISAAAEKCCGLLQLRARNSTDERELIRAATRPPSDSDGLLRAQISTEPTCTAELLRAAADIEKKQVQRIG